MLSELHQIRTKDGLLLEGLFFRPRKRGKTAAFWLSGLTGRFSNNPDRVHILASLFNRHGIAFAIFDNRGAGVVTPIKSTRKRRITLGTALEKFEDSEFDIAAVIRFLRRQGYSKIFLLGHSTGANKSAYYAWKRRGRGLAGIVLLGAVSDIPPMKAKFGRKYARVVREAERMARQGKGGEFLAERDEYGSLWSADRFLSITKEGRREDTFPYYNPKRHFYWARHIRLPMLVVFGSREEHAHQPIQGIMNIFKREIPSRFFTGSIIKNAKHSFAGKERELTLGIIRWITRVQKR